MAQTSSAETIQIVINGMPRDVLRDIDQLAQAEGRSRASYIRRLLAQIVASKKTEKVAA